MKIWIVGCSKAKGQGGGGEHGPSALSYSSDSGAMKIKGRGQSEGAKQPRLSGARVWERGLPW